MSFYTNFEIYDEEDRDMIIDLKVNDKQMNAKYPYEPLNTDIIEVSVPTVSGTDLVKTLALSQVVLTTPSQGRITVSLTGAEATTMINGTVKIKITRAGKTRIFLAAGAIVKKTIGNC